jgi:hypothetical protein
VHEVFPDEVTGDGKRIPVIKRPLELPHPVPSFRAAILSIIALSAFSWQVYSIGAINRMNEQTLKKLAKPLLALAAFIWGSSFFIMKNSLDDMPVFFLLGFRFIAAALLLSLIFLKSWRNLSREY